MERAAGLGYLLDLNRHYSEAFIAAKPAREAHWKEHRTELAGTSCMDGRIHLGLMTNTPLGLIQTWDNLGGLFDFRWRRFQLSVKDWVDCAVQRDRVCVLLVTYHFSRSNAHLGCRGFDYNLQQAKRETRLLVGQIDQVFERSIVYPIHAGIETDWESLILHGENGQVLNLASPHCDGFNEQSLRALLHGFYPTIPLTTLADIVPLIQGNIVHVRAIQASNRPVVEMDHCESVLALGRGLDWINKSNLALTVSPFAPDLRVPIEKAAGILLNNVQSGRAQRPVLLTAVPYRQNGYNKRLAIFNAKTLMATAQQVVAERVPELVSSLEFLTGIVDIHTRALEVVTVT